MRFFYLFFCVAFLQITTAQTKKTLALSRIENPPKIDGVLDDVIWENLQIAENFLMVEPGNGDPERDTHKTQVKMAYDNEAIYIAAYLYDNQPDLILKQFSQRDNIRVQADNFLVSLNTNNDGINDTQFIITSAGTIADAKISSNGEDFNWNSVWEGKVTFDDKGWYVEMKIPYRTLRFPEQEVQNWSVQFAREIKHLNEIYTWNYIDKSKGRITEYNGLLTGISNINPPLRLTLYPYAQGVTTSYDNTTDTSFSAGLDVKYGLNDAFTLDATLIPDFGQTAFDEVSLNLGPFEQVFDENRAFFTEGVDLFTKGDQFFSRRIGNGPTGSVDDLAANEEIIERPSKVGLLNALKISGRTEGNLGIGFFNAVTENTHAIVRNTDTNTTREVLIEPLSNYNIFVLDQQFNGNSSVSLINTNVVRNGSGFRDANVTATAFSVANKANSYRASGTAAFSRVNELSGIKNGFSSELDVFRIKGNFRYRVGHDFSNKTFDNNDLGLSFRNNYNNFSVRTSYEIFEPTSLFNKYRISLSFRHQRLYQPSIKTRNNFGLNWFFATKNRMAFGGNLNYTGDERDYFEARIDGRVALKTGFVGGTAFLSTDYRKKLAFDVNIGHWTGINEEDLGDVDRNTYNFSLSPRYRFSDKFLVVWDSRIFNRFNNVGYVSNNGTDVYFGVRDIKSVENALRTSYNFDPYKAIDLRVRNSWSSANYASNTFFILNEDGTRTKTDYDTSDPNTDPNTNFNIWNLDLSFRWRFAPGSEATVLYRNQIFNNDNLSELEYNESLENLFEQPIQHTLSLRLVYFIDANTIFKG